MLFIYLYKLRRVLPATKARRGDFSRLEYS